MAGSAILDAAAKFKVALFATAAHQIGCDSNEITLDIDRLLARGETVMLTDLAGLTIEGLFLNKRQTYSFGTHAAHVAVDPATGKVDILDYIVVEDVGRVMNPLTMNGQLIGSLVQGLGGALLEELKYDDTGQLLTASLADYLLPTANDFPRLRSVVLENFPSPINPLGVKGAGEGGTIGAGGCIANAVASALESLGVSPCSLPLSPSTIWEMIHASLPRAADTI
jgi:carbon-monoxide dehydrogenase large subunit